MAKGKNYARVPGSSFGTTGFSSVARPSPKLSSSAHLQGSLVTKPWTRGTTGNPHIMINRPPITVPMSKKTNVYHRGNIHSTSVVSLYGVNFLSFRGTSRCCQCDYPATLRIQSKGKIGMALYKKMYRYICSSGCFRKALLNASLQGIIPLDEKTHKMLGLDGNCQDNVTEKIITDVGLTDKHAKMTRLKISNTGSDPAFPFELQIIALKQGTYPIHVSLKFTENQFKSFIKDNKAVLDGGLINRWWDPKEEQAYGDAVDSIPADFTDEGAK